MKTTDQTTSTPRATPVARELWLVLDRAGVVRFSGEEEIACAYARMFRRQGDTVTVIQHNPA